MTDAWRIKKYYKPRVLIETTRVLNPQFDDSLICITGAHFELLRNLTQYLHYHSTFVSEYHDGHYVAPDNTEWDSLQAIVADLEEVLMGCEDITGLLESILEQATCACQRLTDAVEIMVDVPGYGPALPPIIDGYLGTGDMQPADTYGGNTVIEAKRCAVAQLVFWQAWEWTTEIMQPVAEQSIDILLPAAMVALAVMVGPGVLGIPTGVILAVCWHLIEIATAGALWDVQNAIWSYQKELVCAVWSGLAVDFRAAEDAAVAVIEDMAGMSPLDKIALHILYAPWAMKLAAMAWENQTDWAVANVESGYCDDCAWWFERAWSFPPCPSDWVGSFACSDSGWLSVNADIDGHSVTFELPDILTNVDVTLDCHFVSKFGSGWSVGYVQLEYQDVAEDWHMVSQLPLQTSMSAGLVNTCSDTGENKTVPRNVLRLEIHGQPGQHDTDPWPAMAVYVRVRVIPTA